MFSPLQDPDVQRHRRAVKTATVTVTEAARILGISRTTAYEAVRDGSLRSIRVRRRILIPTRTDQRHAVREHVATCQCVTRSFGCASTIGDRAGPAWGSWLPSTASGRFRVKVERPEPARTNDLDAGTAASNHEKVLRTPFR